MMKKTIKVRGTDERTSLVEFLVDKRVRYLEYLREIHSEEGALWMNTVYLNRAIVCAHFGVDESCLYHGGRAPDETTIHVRVERETAGASVETMPFVLGDLPVAGRAHAGPEWQGRYLNLYAALGTALSDLLVVPMGGEELIESVYGLLLELEVFFSSGTASKAIAQRNLKSFRQHISSALSDTLNVAQSPTEVARSGLPAPNSTAGAADAEGQGPTKYVFFSPLLLNYTAAPPSYDTVVPALCSVLLYLYRRLCDYELTASEESVRRILSIDKRIQKCVIERLTKEIQKVARFRTLRETFLLSPKGIMVGAAGDTDTFIADLMQAYARAEEAPKDAESAAGGDDMDSDDGEDF